MVRLSGVQRVCSPTDRPPKLSEGTASRLPSPAPTGRRPPAATGEILLAHVRPPLRRRPCYPAGARRVAGLAAHARPPSPVCPGPKDPSSRGGRRAARRMTGLVGHLGRLSTSGLFSLDGGRPRSVSSLRRGGARRRRLPCPRRDRRGPGRPAVVAGVATDGHSERVHAAVPLAREPRTAVHRLAPLTSARPGGAGEGAHRSGRGDDDQRGGGRVSRSGRRAVRVGPASRSRSGRARTDRCRSRLRSSPVRASSPPLCVEGGGIRPSLSPGEGRRSSSPARR